MYTYIFTSYCKDMSVVIVEQSHVYWWCFIRCDRIQQ